MALALARSKQAEVSLFNIHICCAAFIPGSAAALGWRSRWVTTHHRRQSKVHCMLCPAPLKGRAFALSIASHDSRVRP